MAAERAVEVAQAPGHRLEFRPGRGLTAGANLDPGAPGAIRRCCRLPLVPPIASAMGHGSCCAL